MEGGLGLHRQRMAMQRGESLRREWEKIESKREEGREKEMALNGK